MRSRHCTKKGPGRIPSKPQERRRDKAGKPYGVSGAKLMRCMINKNWMG